MARNTNPSPAVLAIVKARNNDVCLVCDARRAEQTHHRRPRGAGGSQRADTNAPQNLIRVCHRCHAEIESQRDWARGLGYLVRQSHDPAEVPIWLRGRWFLLDDVGGMCESVPAA
ncbi:HNH endonuclease [Nocardia nova]|uniref:HNH endonuclease n=1 Tax=Nocardia nova TaxID=37330 RepID=UPI001894EAF6|nr:HNH endonuclease [Nocardia nova]MBF6277000.1 HNH endonuclease [Nocardia nova]